VNDLIQQKCKACRPGELPLVGSEIAELMQQLDGWNLVEEGSLSKLEKVFKFKNYQRSLEFTNQVAQMAEKEDHHPLIVLEWGRVTVQWWTHVVKGLHKNDFIMAAKTDALIITG